MKKFYILMFLALTSLIIIFNCEIDHGLYPINYKITGKVIFFKGKSPANTDRIEVFALKEFPPKDPQNFLYRGQSGALDYTKGNEVNYEIQVDPTTYQMLAVWWKEKDHPWDLTGLLGFYTGNLQSIFPDSVSVSRENPIADSVDIYANWEVVSKDAAISGKVTYEGKWPEDKKQWLLLAIYRLKPASEFQYFLFENVDYSQPVRVDTSSYRLAVNSGVYNYIVLYWVGKSFSKLTDLVVLGFYQSPDNPQQPGRVEVRSGETVKNIDIHVNFNNIEFP